MAVARHTFHDFLQPSDASPGSATPSSGSSSPEVFFDAPEQLSPTMLPTTPTRSLVNNVEEFHDAQEMPAAGVSVYIEDYRATHGLGDKGHGEADSETGRNGLYDFDDGHTEPDFQGDQKAKARRLLTDFLPRRQLSNNLREETRKIVQMLSNDKVCKIDRPSLGLQDRLQSLVQRSAGKRTTYVKGPRVCSTLVKSIVKRTQDSMYFRRTSFQGYPGKQEERPPLPVFNKPVPSYTKPPKCTKAPERDGTPLRGSQVNNQTNNANVFELVIKRRKQNSINEISSGSTAPVSASPPGPLSTITYNNHNNTPHGTPDNTSTGENVHVTSTVDLSKSRRGDFENDLISVEFKISVPYGDYDDVDTPEATEHRPSFPQVAEDAESDEGMEFSSEEPFLDTPSKDDGQKAPTTPNLNTTGMLKDPPNKQTKMKETTAVSQNFPDVQMENSSNLTNGHVKQAADPPPKNGSQAPSSGGSNASPSPRQRGDSMTNGVIDLRKHIASLNKVSLTFGAKSNEHTSDDKNVAATNDSPASPKPYTAPMTTQSTSEAKPRTVQVAAERGTREQAKSSSPGNAPKFHTATAMANLSLPTYRGGQALERRLSSVSSTKSLQRSLSTLDLLYPDEDIPSSAANNALHIETLMRLKTDNLVARHGGKSNLHLYPTSPRQTSPAPAPEPPAQKAAPESTSGKEKTEVTPDAAESLPPLHPNVQRVKRESVSRQASKEEDVSGQRTVSRNGSLEHPCPGSRRGSHLLQRPGSRRGSKMPSFSQDTLRKCLIAAVDQCYNTEWEETSDSNVVRDDSMSQEEVNKSLVKAVCRHDAEKVRIMLKLGGDPNVKHNGSPVVLRAAREGALYVMQALLAAGADVDVRSDMGNSPLHLAARGGYSEVAVQLVHSGAFVDAINRSGVTPLQMALAYGHLDVARSLLRLNADMFLQNKVGETAYDVANDLGYIGLSGAPREVRRDSGVGTRVEPCSNDVPVAVRMIQGIEVGCAGTVDDCLREGASPNTLLPLALHWPAHASVLHRAAHHGHDLIVRLLLAAGADIQARDVVGNTPLHVATQAGHNRVVKILLDSGASLEAVSQSGMSPLHRAASKGKELTCNLLIRRGANPRAEDSSGRTPADWARKRDFKHLSQKLAYRRKSSNTLLAEGDGRLDLNHLHRLHEAALMKPRQSPEPMECEE